MAKKENTIPTIIDTPEALTAKIAAMKEAQKIFATFTQEQVDKIFKAAATAADKARIPLAKDAVEETGMGIVEDKVIKNHYAAEYVYNAYKNTRTCGVIEEDTAYGIKKIAEPIGLIAAVIPTTNPTSTAIFKTLIALKTRNAIIISPHPRAKKCTIEAAKVVLEAAVEAGAPEGIIGWIDVPSLDLTNQVMREADIILATGGPGMVKAAYSSGKPALGVGPGNTPVIIDDSADIRLAVNSIIHSKTFDNGMICASEQSVTVLESIYKKVKEEFLYRGCYFLKPDELEKVRKTILINGALNAKIVGQKAYLLCLACETDFVAQNAEYTASANAMLEVAVKNDAADRDALMASKNDEGHTVEEMVTEKSGQTGEKIELAYYARIEAPYCAAYVHFNKKLGTILGFNKEVPAEVAHTVAMQATAMAPVSISEADCPAEIVEHERKIAVEAMKQDPKNANKPEAILEKIAEGKMRKFFEENTLLNQPVVGEKETIAEFIHKADKDATVIAYKRFALEA